MRTIKCQWAAIREPTPTPRRPFRFADIGVHAECSVTAIVLLAAALLPVTVTLSHVRTDGDIEEYDYTMKPAKALIDTDEVISQIRSRLPAQAAGDATDDPDREDR